MNNIELFKLAADNLHVNNFVDSLYDAWNSDLDNEDKWVVASTVDALTQYLKGNGIRETNPDFIQFGMEGGYVSYKVRIQTGEIVPVFVPNDGTTPYSEW